MNTLRYLQKCLRLPNHSARGALCVYNTEKHGLFRESRLSIRHMSAVNARVVDMRSDVRTIPSPEMMKAMMSATFSDDVFDEEQTVKELQTKMAAMFGKEAALFVVSGTMANLLAAGAHCPHRGREVIMGDRSHTFLWEQGNISQFLGIHARPLINKSDGTIDLNEIEEGIRVTNDTHQPLTGMITIENTHNYYGGKVIPIQYFTCLREISNRNGNIPIHLDGSRLLNASVALGVDPKELTKDVDSVSMCFSKAIGAPVGSILVGSERLIELARRLRKGLGGGWRQPGPLAAACLHALGDAKQRLALDHSRAKRFAQTLLSNCPNLVAVDLEGVHTNLIPVNLLKVTPAQLCRRLEEVKDDEVRELGGERVVVRVSELSRTSVRFVTHCSVSEEDLDLAARKISYVLHKLHELNNKN